MGLKDYANVMSAGIGGVGSFISTYLTNQANRQLARENMAWQQQENERAFQRDLQMWNLQNQYNTPAAQRARLEAAGMNPQLAFGNVSANSGNASSAPSLNPATAITPEMAQYQAGNVGMGLADAFQQSALFQQQRKMNDAAIKEKEANTLLKLFELGQNEDLRPYVLALAQEKVFNMQEDTRLKNMQADYTEMKTSIEKDLHDVNLDYQKLKLETAQQKQVFEVAMSAMNVLLADAQINLTKAQRSNVMQVTANLALEGDIKSYWDSMHRLLGTQTPNAGGQVGALFNQFMTNFFQLGAAVDESGGLLNFIGDLFGF